MIEISNTTKVKINSARIKKIAEAFLHEFERNQVDISIAVIGNKKMRELNCNYRGADKTTDVLSFAGAEWEGNLLGEVLINPHEVKKISKYKEILEFVGFSYPLSNVKKVEDYLFYFILVHGLLHLLGYDDEEEVNRQEMLKLGRNFLKKML
jgi:probable rRNA maturation factor